MLFGKHPYSVLSSKLRYNALEDFTVRLDFKGVGISKNSKNFI